MGLLLVVLSIGPLWLLLAKEASPLAQETARATLNQIRFFGLGLLVTLAGALALALLISPERVDALVSNGRGVLTRLASHRFAWLMAGLGALGAFAVSGLLWTHQTPLGDAVAQLVHAKYLANGMAAGPAGYPFEAWILPNTLVTEKGWIAQYPPGHVALLALGFVLHATWLIPPLVMAATAGMTSLAAERLLPDDIATARLGAIFTALSPLLLLVAAANMSHATTAALGSTAAYCALRAKQGGFAWAGLAGVALGWMFATRPLSALTIGAVVIVGVWFTDAGGARSSVAVATRRAFTAVVAALPFGLAVAAYNMHFFGGPFRFGYTAYLGPNHGLGFHANPWGDQYGLSQALGFTSSDFHALGQALLQTPVSAVLLVGLALLAARKLVPGAKFAVAWALIPSLAMTFYWHHDLQIGPRMLSDAAPAWCLATAAATVALVKRVPAVPTRFGSLVPRSVLILAFMVAGLGALAWVGPRTFRQYAVRFAIPTFDQPIPARSLVFIHDAWTARISSKLAASGMRADSVSAAMAQNATCKLEQFATAVVDRSPAAGAMAAEILFEAGQSDGSDRATLPSGVPIRVFPNEELSEACLREALSDRAGVLPLMRYVWQGDLPGIDGTDIMYVRDLGPERNAAILASLPGRTPVLAVERPPGHLSLILYDAAMDALWSTPAVADVPGR